MRLAVLLSFVLAAQAAAVGDATAHLRYERAIEMPALARGASGTVCAVLDADAFAHAASRSGDDLRVYREGDAGAVEVPFTLQESESEPDDDGAARVENVAERDGVVSFDLAMPQQAYTAVELHLAAKDFLAQATVSGEGGRALGQFTLFDLSEEHLGRSTELALEETRSARLHVALRLWRPDGRPVAHPSAAIVQGADVPPSREAQTLYTTVAATSAMHREGGEIVAAVSVPAHVPVERVRFVLDAKDARSLVRTVRIEAAADDGPVEAVDGTIARVHWVAPRGDAPEVRYEALAVDATLGANLRQAAVVRVRVPDAALPLHGVELQMRQRSFCFEAVAGARYTLRYGDAGLAAPVYAEGAQESHAQASVRRPVMAVLGPERVNPAFVARAAQVSAAKRHPAMFWVGLLSMVILCAALALHRARFEKREIVWRRGKS